MSDKKIQELLCSAEYAPVSQAPSMNHFIEVERRSGTALSILMRDESYKRYLAYDQKSGTCFLVQNPCLLTYQSMTFERDGTTRGTITRVRPKPYRRIDGTDPKKKAPKQEEIWL